MSKQIMIKEEVVKKLDNIRREKKCSYSEAIELLLDKVPEDIWLLEINKRFFELESMIPDMRAIFEVMRVITIRFYKLPIEAKTEYIKEISRKLEEILSHIIKIEGVQENGKKDNIFEQ